MAQLESVVCEYSCGSHVSRSRVMVPSVSVALPCGVTSSSPGGQIPDSYETARTDDGRTVVFRNGMSIGFLSTEGK